MNKNLRLLTLAAVMPAILLSVACDKLRARDQINKGVEAFKNTHFEEAAQHFSKASELDPSLLNAHMYLAGAYQAQFVPGADTPDNNAMAENAIKQYQTVLDANPVRDQKITAAKGVAGLYFQLKKFDDSKKYQRMVSELDPNDPEPYYSIGVMDWTAVYAPRMEERAKLGMKPEENLNPKNKDQKKVCDELNTRNMPIVQDGIDNLNKALTIRPDYDDAMAYMNLMYREKADVECSDLAARAADLKTADGWVDKTLETKKAKAEKAPANGVAGDQGK
jgi:tetratricopeptide (TPR) repeat protein